MNNRYQIIFLGLNKPQDHFQQCMTKLGVPSPVIDRIMGSAPVVLKQDIDLIHAKNYAEAVRSAGGEIRIQKYSHHQTRSKDQIKIEPLENFTMCPQCGYKQIKAESCVRCGLDLKT